MAIGPGLIVMLADTDAGSLIVAAQSGATWGYKLLLLQAILIPILYIIQELTLRLGLVTKTGHSKLIKEHFGSFWAWVSASTLIICCVGALTSELSGIAGVGEMFGIPTYISVILTIVFLLWLVWTKSYNSVERVALAIGIFELVYLFIAWKAHPAASEIIQGIKSMPLHNRDYLYLVSANIGAVIMPWMIFYQQSAVVDKQLNEEHLTSARIDTFIGAIITQLIMAAVIIATAATIGKNNPGASLDSIQQISHAIIPFVGVTAGKLLFALGMLGGSLVATVVVLLAVAWSIGEITGRKHSLQDSHREAPWFYLSLTLSFLFSAALVIFHLDLVKLNVAINVLNAFLLPIVLLFLFLLASKVLPGKYRLRGWYAWVVGIVMAVTSIFGVVSGILGLI